MAEKSLTASSSTRSVKKDVAKMGYVERYMTTPTLIRVFSRAIVSLFSSYIQGKDNKPPTLFRYIFYTLVRNITDLTTTGQIHSLYPTTDEAYHKICKKRKVQPNTIILEDGTTAHWIGSPSAKKILINHHGGGYVLQASEFMVDFMFRVQADMAKQGKDFAVLFVAYDLAPEAKYPRQLQQAAMVLKHVTEDLGKEPSNIFLSGDSAGGNLTVSLLSHVSHPHPDPTIPRLKLGSKLGGVVLVSPWVDFAMDAAAYQGRKDLIGPIAGKKWSAAWLGTPWPHTANTDYYNQATLAPASWWNDVQFEEALIVAGKDELLYNSIETFVKRWQNEVPSLKGKVAWLGAVGEAHDMPSLDLQMGYEKPGEQARMIYSWLGSKL